MLGVSGCYLMWTPSAAEQPAQPADLLQTWGFRWGLSRRRRLELPRASFVSVVSTPDEVLITGGSGELRWDVGADWVRLSGSGLALESRAYPCGARRGARVLEAYRPSTLEGSRGPPAAQNRVHG